MQVRYTYPTDLMIMMSFGGFPDLSDPSKFTTQMKKESSTSVVAHPSIKRHGTSIRFSDHTRPTLRTTQSMDKDHADKGKEGACESMLEVSVELESCVSTLELIQLPMDKTGRY